MFEIIKNDITRVCVDAIVNAANPALSGGGGVDGAIHRAAGKGLDRECAALGGCPRGEARITAGYCLPCKYVIHTAGPVWSGGDKGEENILRACYRSSLELAQKHGCTSVAFPLISSGIYGYPVKDAYRIACEEIIDYLSSHEVDVYLVLMPQICDIIFEGTRRRFDKYVVKTAPMCAGYAMMRSCAKLTYADSAVNEEGQLSEDKIRSMLDESFARMLMRKIDEKQMTDAECYKRANVDRKLFSKIRSDEGYHPSKTTALAFAVALRLDEEETRELLAKAGYALSRSNIGDIIVEYYIAHKKYDIYEINETLFAYDMKLLGR